MNPQLIEQIKAARRVSVPIVGISTPDPAATIKSIRDSVNGGPMLQWDGADGVRSLNDEGKAARGEMVGENDPTLANLPLALTLARKLPQKSVLFIHMSGRWLIDPMSLQALWNLRDVFKGDHRMLVLLGPSIDLPPELAGDVVVLDEPLPDADQLEQLIRRVHSDAGIKAEDATLGKAVEAVQGLPAFQAEQVVEMSLSRKGVDVASLWERKRKQIELTPGLRVHREKTSFEDIGGVPIVKQFLTKIMEGRARPNAIVFVDEIEKFLAGAMGGAADSSGVSQDQLGQLLSYMQDQNAVGMIFVGPPGAAKSAVAKAAGNQAGIPTIQLDLGAMKGSLVGSSEQNLRGALKVITSVSNGRSLWIATCNAITDLPPELRRRFTLGTFFFDLPDTDERRAIWDIWLGRYELTNTGGKIRKTLALPDDAGWTGAEIRQCCDIAWRMGCSLKEAAGFVVPVSRSAAEQLEKLRRAAEGRFLSASKPGIYTRETTPAQEPGRRKLELED